MFLPFISKEMDSDESFSFSESFNQENHPPVANEEAAVAKILQFAKLELNCLSPNVQQINFAKALQADEIKLLELNKDVEHYVENGGKLILKGNATENCVLCTDNKTFEVKDTEISNALLLTRGVHLDQLTTPASSHNALILSDNEVSCVCHSYLELRPIKPKINSLLALLESSIYEGPEAEENSVRRLTQDAISAEIMASDEEIQAALSRLNAMELDGYVRLIDFDYLSRVIGSITALIEENSWDFTNFSRNETLKTLSTLYRAEIVDHVLKSYGSITQGGDSTADGWCLNEDKVRERCFKFFDKSSPLDSRSS